MPMSDGAVFAGYTIVGVLTSGAVGEVYLAQHPRLPRQEELTILSAAASADPDVRRRFEHEAGIAAGLSHPHISAVRDRGEHDGRLWFTTDHLNGTAAATLLHTDSPAGMPTEMVCDIVDAIADALDYAHTEDLLHREVSPSHILLTEAGNSRRGRILLTDFGIARDTGETTLNTSTAALAYSSPEQLMGMALDGRTDQYSLAATAYHLLTGSPPFAHTNSAVLISKHLNSPPPRLADTHPNLAALDPVVARALSKDPTNRYNTCTEFAQALTTSCSGHTGAAPSLAPPTTATTTEPDDLPQPPTTLSDWGTPQPPPPTPAPSPPPQTPKTSPGEAKPSAFDRAAGWYPDPEGRSVRRYFDGTRWTGHWERLDERRRQQILQSVLVRHLNSRTRVIAQSSTSAKIVVIPVSESQGIHVVLALLTCGLWLIVWVLIMVLNQRNAAPQSFTVSVDEYGTVTWS